MNISLRGRPAVFLDRDGVIIANRADHIKSWDEVEFLPDVFEALRRLASADIPVVIVTNQGVVGRGIITEEAAWAVQKRIVSEIEASGGRIAASYLCPHHPDAGCFCRKPLPGMIRQAVEEHGITVSGSVMVGDAVTDVQSGLAAGCDAIFVRSGRGGAQESLLNGEACAIFEDLPEVVDALLRDDRYQKVRQAT